MHGLNGIEVVDDAEVEVVFSDSGNEVVSGREKVGNNVEVNSAVFV